MSRWIKTMSWTYFAFFTTFGEPENKEITQRKNKKKNKKKKNSFWNSINKQSSSPLTYFRTAYFHHHRELELKTFCLAAFFLYQFIINNPELRASKITSHWKPHSQFNSAKNREHEADSRGSLIYIFVIIIISLACTLVCVRVFWKPKTK